MTTAELMAMHAPADLFDGPITDLSKWLKKAATVNRCYRKLCMATDERDPGPAGYVYVLGSSDLAHRPVYVGKTVNPSMRFNAHRRREWWSRVEHARVSFIDCRGHELCTPTVRDRVLLDWEAVFIDAFEPDANRYWPAHVPDLTGLI